MNGFTFAYITARNETEAEKISIMLLMERLAGCTNIIRDVKSLYWEGEEIKNANECVVIAKTKEDNKERIINKVKDMHSYETPCIVFLPVQGGNPDYFKWLEKAIIGDDYGSRGKG